MLTAISSYSDISMPLLDIFMTVTDQPSSVPSAPQMPEKRVLELILDILQRWEFF